MKRGKSFAATGETLPSGLSDHNAALPGDIVTSLFINYEWRRLISDTMQSYADSVIRFLPDAETDNFRNKFQALLDDFYTEDIVPEIAVTIQRNTDQAIPANVATAIDWNEVINQTPIVLWTGLPAKLFLIPTGGTGYYSISGVIWFPGTVANQNRSVRITVNGLTVYQSAFTTLSQSSIVFAWGLELVDGDEINIVVLCAVAITIQGDSTGLTTCTIVREYATG